MIFFHIILSINNISLIGKRATKNHHSEHCGKPRSSLVSAGEQHRSKFRITFCFCMLAIAGNIATSFLADALHTPMFLDTIFTVAVTFYAGLVPGLIVAALHNPIVTFIYSVIYRTEIFYFDCLYALCKMLIAFSTWLFSRNKKEFFFSKTVTVLYLLIIVFVSSFLSCFSASMLNTFIRPLLGNFLGFLIDAFSIAFQKLKFGVFLSYLLPRIPITVLDRLICTFSGFGLYRLVERRFSC